MSIQVPLRKIFQKRGSLPRFAISLSGTMVAALCLVLAACVAWAFFMGFLVGKGQDPQAKIQDMTGIALSGAGEKEEAAGRTADAAEPESREEARDEGGHAAAPMVFSGPGEPEAAPVIAASKPPAPRREKPKTHDTPKNRSGESDNAIYDYTYQLAAYRSQADAVRLQADLKKAGVKANVRQSGKVHLVVASLRGNQDSVAKLNATLGKLKLGKPLLLGKKPVEAKKRAKNK